MRVLRNLFTCSTLATSLCFSRSITAHIFMMSILLIVLVLLLLTATNAMSSCCPPGSWGAPYDPSSRIKLRGTSLTIGKDTPAYYTCGGSSTSKSSTDGKPTRAIIVFPDVWGMYPRTKAICDTLAASGSNGGQQVLLFDPFRGETYADHKDDTAGWLSSVPYKPNVETDVNTCIDYLVTKKGVDRNRIGALGFCWGAWAIAKSNSQGIELKCAVWAHPSTSIERRMFDRDEKKMLEDMQNIPVLMMPAGNDDERLKDGGELADIIRSKGGRVFHFPDMVHGWTTRSDTKVPEIRRDAEKALSMASDFFNEYL